MYPLKYALKKIYRGISDWDYFGTQREELYSFEASKCYLAEEHKIYHKYKDPKIKYEVSFPNNDSFDVEFNFNGQFYNTELVDSIFDTLDEANIESNKLNKELQNDYCWKSYFRTYERTNGVKDG